MYLKRQGSHALRVRRQGVDHHDAEGRVCAGCARCRVTPYDGHTLPEALEQAAILSETAILTAEVDRGYRGVEVPGTRILRSGQRRGITKGLKAMIKRRSAIEPTIGHMKSDGKLAKTWLKGRLGDALHAILCGAGHNIRMLLRRLRRFYAYVLISW